MNLSFYRLSEKENESVQIFCPIRLGVIQIYDNKGNRFIDNFPKKHFNIEISIKNKIEELIYLSNCTININQIPLSISTTSIYGILLIVKALNELKKIQLNKYLDPHKDTYFKKPYKFPKFIKVNEAKFAVNIEMLN